MATDSALKSTEYIGHHLANWHVGEGFWTFHVDSLLVSGVIGLVVFLAMARAASKATAGVRAYLFSADAGLRQNRIDTR